VTEAAAAGTPGAGGDAEKPGASTIRSLRNPNFRLYLAGQAVSQTGNWFQQTAEIWLILTLTGSGAAVGLLSALRFGPLLLFGIPAGLLVDRLDRRRLLLTTQGIYMLAAATLAVVTFSASPSIHVVYAMVLAQGIVGAVDNPLRRSFVRDLVTDEELPNAVSLNSTMHTMARSVGPAIAGFLIAAVGVPLCFAINAVSYGVVLVSLLLLNPRAFRAARRLAPAKGQLRAGFRYAWANRRIRRTLAMVTVLGLSALNWNVILPVYATETFGGGSSLYGVLVALLGVGAFVGGVVVARTTIISGSHFRVVGALMAISFVVVSIAPVLPIAFFGLAMLGAAATSFQILAQTRLQLEADDAMSGRILAIYSVALVGTKPIGGLVVGIATDSWGPRIAFGACAVVVAVLIGTLAYRRAARAGARAAEAAAARLGTPGSADPDSLVVEGEIRSMSEDEPGSATRREAQK
jgi:MFS family permease